MRAAVQVTDPVEALDDDCQQRKQPVAQHAVGMVMLDMLHAEEVLAVVEPLILDLPAALGQTEEHRSGGAW